MDEFKAEGLGATLTISGSKVTISAGFMQRSLTGGKHLELLAAEITGLHVKQARVMTNGEFILGTVKGKVNVIYTRKHADAFQQAARLLRTLGVKEDDAVKKLPFYSAKGATLPTPSTSKTPVLEPDGSREFTLDEAVFAGVIEVIGNRGTHPNVMPRDDGFAKLDVVGESNYQTTLAAIARSGDGDSAGWQYGFLAPEQDNPYDSNAVAVYIITRGKGQPLDAELVGYLPRALAAKLSPKLVRQLLTKGRIVPLLLRITGGTADRPSYGVLAQAYCELVSD